MSEDVGRAAKEGGAMAGTISTAEPGAAQARMTNNADEENISGPENEQSEASGVGGGHRFENLIKSMLARLELHGSLAPIQQYGRHQRKGNQRKKNQG